MDLLALLKGALSHELQFAILRIAEKYNRTDHSLQRDRLVTNSNDAEMAPPSRTMRSNGEALNAARPKPIDSGGHSLFSPRRHLESMYV